MPHAAELSLWMNDLVRRARARARPEEPNTLIGKAISASRRAATRGDLPS